MALWRQKLWKARSTPSSPRTQRKRRPSTPPVNQSPGRETCADLPAMSQLREKTARMSASSMRGSVYHALGGVEALEMGAEAEGQGATPDASPRSRAEEQLARALVPSQRVIWAQMERIEQHPRAARAAAARSSCCAMALTSFPRID